VEVLRFALLGCGIGAAYALSSLGVVFTYRGSGVVNFAHGAVGMVAAFIFYELRDEHRWATGYAVVAALALGAATGALFYVAAIRRLRNAPALTKVIATLGLLVFAQAIARQLWSDDVQLVRSVLPNDAVDLPGGIALGRDRILLAGLAVLLTILFTVAYRRTRVGLAALAIAEDEQAAAALGWSPDLNGAVNWAIGGALAAGAAVLLAPMVGLSVGGLSLLVVPAIACALAGGFRSFAIATCVAFGIGALQAVISRYSTTAGLADSVPMLVIVVALVLRGSSLPRRNEGAVGRLPAVGTGAIPVRVTAAGLLLACVAILTVSDVWVDAITTTLIFGMIALSLVVVAGYCGQLSLAQFALAGFGGLLAARSSTALGGELLLAIAVGAAAAGLLGVVVAIPSTRTRGMTLAIATMGLAVVVDSLVLQSELSGGVGGLDVEVARIAGIRVDGVAHPERFALVALGVFALAAVGVANLRKGHTGRRLLAVRANERAAASIGIAVSAAKVYAFAVAGALAGAAGSLFALRTQHPNLSGYGLLPSINVVVFAVVGGLGSVAGAGVAALLAPGALLARAFSQSESAVRWIQVLSGLGTITIVLRHPNGVAMLWRHRKRDGDRRQEPPVPVRTERPPVTRMPPRTLRVQDLVVRFGGVVAVDGLSFELRPGRVVGLIGPNGAGKTTVIDAVTGYVRATEGAVLLDGRPVTRCRPSRLARLGVVRTFQSVDLFEDLSVLDNIRAGADAWSGWGYVRDLAASRDAPIPDVAGSAIDVLGLRAHLHQLPHELSHGQRRLVGIARALATGPSVLLLDEPAAGLDATETAELATLVREVSADWGVAVLLVEHDVEMVLSTVDHVEVLDFGRSIASGTAAEIRTDPAVITAYLGTHDEELTGGASASRAQAVG
jgi:sulfate-transporting ATPase